MKPLRIAAIVLAVLTVLLGGGIAVVASRLDADNIKRELAAAVLEKKQRTLKIDGAVELSFWPSIGVKLGKVSLSERNSEQVFAAVESARVGVAVRPLLSQQIVVEAVAVDGLKATLIRHKDGTLNIDDLLARDESASRPLRLDITGIRVANGELAWRDEKTGGSAAVAGLDLAVGRVQADTGKKVFQVDGLAVKGRVDTDDRSKSLSDSFDIRLEALKLSFAPEASGGETVTLSAVLAGAQRHVDVKLALSGVAGTLQALRVAKLALAVDVEAGASAVNGTLTAPFAADLEHQTMALENFSGEFIVASPQLPMKRLRLPVNGSLRADFARQSADGNLSAQIDESKLALKFKVAGFAPLALGFDLDIDRLNLDKYLPPKQAAQTQAGAGKLDFPAWKDASIDGTVRIGSLQLAEVKASNFRLQIGAANGRLRTASRSAGRDGPLGK